MQSIYMQLYAPYRMLFLDIIQFGINEMSKAETSQGMSNYRT